MPNRSASLRVLCLTAFALLFASSIQPQSTVNQWTWMGGNDTTTPAYTYDTGGYAGIYGTLGIPASSNLPGSRESAVAWTDRFGNFWLFGGSGYAANGTPPYADYLNDLWQYSPASGLWTWMGGSSTTDGAVFGTYGTLGRPSPSNIPGARASASGWTDSDGNLWLFGGYGCPAAGCGVLNDLWRYSPSTGQWTWMGGSSIASGTGTGGIAGVYGAQGTPSSSNIPGSRSYFVTATDIHDNLWLFGGGGFDSLDVDGEMNDLWQYNPTNNQWTWFSGSNTLPGEGLASPASYGTLGVPAPSNTPGGREPAAAWADEAGGIWMFGGSGDAIGLDDLWRFDTATAQWTWMGGNYTPPGALAWPGVYGSLGTPAPANHPGGRFYSLSWTGNDGSLWLFGGQGSDAIGPQIGHPWSGAFLNDLWQYDLSTSQWTWWSGSSIAPQNSIGAPGIYGTLGVPAAINVPGGRQLAATWTDNHGLLWIFGGQGEDSLPTLGFLNDLWRFQPYSSLALIPAPTFSLPPGPYTTPQTVTLAAEPGASIYYTTDGKTPPTAQSTPYTAPINITASETVEAVAIDSDGVASYISGGRYVILTPAATPVFSQPGGIYSQIQSVAISDATPGAVIYYTTDGSIPNTSSPQYQVLFAISSSVTLKAVAYAAGYTPGPVASEIFTFNSSLTSPTLTVLPSGYNLTTAQPLPVTITVRGGSRKPTPTGTITLTSGTWKSSPVSLTSGSATITVPAWQLPVGNDIITATYVPDANSSSTYTSTASSNGVTVHQWTYPCYNLNPNPNPNPASFANPGDFNGDCRSDILWRNTGNNVVYQWLMNGTSIAAQGTPASPSSAWVIQGVGDFDGDGLSDILWWNNATGQVYIWLMNGTSIASQNTPGSISPSSGWVVQGVGDFNGDGMSDILWRNSITGEVYLWLMNGTAIASQQSFGAISSDWTLLGIGDFNADGKADILWRNSNSGEVYIWLMNGASIVSQGSPATVSPASGWTVRGVGDFNRNGTSDILWRNSITGEVYFWFINGTTLTSQASAGSVSSDWVIKGVGDYNGDGFADVLWHNNNGEVYIWEMNGPAITRQGAVLDVSSPWQIAPAFFP